jgi:hypothetical protein
MFSHEFYKIVHIIGIVTLMVALGGAAFLMMAGATTSRRLLAVLHGAGAFLILLGGFGMLARLGIIQGGSFPAWLWLKIGVWLILGAALIVAWRRPGLARPVLFSLPLLAGVATYMAVYKPF